MEQTTPNRLRLSLRSAKKECNERSLRKNILENQDDYVTPICSKKSKTSYHSPTTPKIPTKNKQSNASKTPKSRVNLLKSLHKPLESPVFGSQFLASQECEVGWDCDSPGFSKADLKKKHKKDKDRDVLEPSPQPHRTLFTHQRTVSNKTEMNCSHLSTELDVFLQMNLGVSLQEDMFSESPASPPLNGFIGFGKNSNMTPEGDGSSIKQQSSNMTPEGDGSSIKQQSSPLTGVSLDDISDDFFSESLLEATQVMENTAYKNISGPAVANGYNYGLNKNIINLTTSSIISPIQSSVELSTKRNPSTLSTTTKLSLPSGRAVAEKRQISTINTTSFKRFIPSVTTNVLSTQSGDRTRQGSTFKPQCSSFRLKSGTSCEKNNNNLSIANTYNGSTPNKRTTASRNHYINNAERVSDEINQYNCNNKIPGISLNDKYATEAEPDMPKRIQNGHSPNAIGTGYNNQSIIGKDTIISSTLNMDWTPHSLAKKSKSMADFSPIIAEKSTFKRADSLKAKKEKKMAPMLAFIDDEDESMFLAAASTLDAIEKGIVKSASLNLTGNNSTQDFWTCDDDDDFLGSETLAMLTQVENSVMNENNGIRPTTNMTQQNGPVPPAKFEKLNPPSSKVAGTNGRCTLSRKCASTHQITKQTAHSFTPTGRSSHSFQKSGPTAPTKSSIRPPMVVYSKEEVALKRQEAMKRMAKRKQS